MAGRQGGGGPALRAALGVALGLVALVLGFWFLGVTVRDTGELGDGVRARAVLLEEPAECGGGCEVAVEVGGRSVVGELPAHQLLKRYHAGSSVPVRYRADNPRRMALEDGVGTGALLLAALLPLLGLLMVVVWAAAWFKRRRRAGGA